MTEIISNLIRFAYLPGEERKLTGRALVLTLVTDTALRFVSFKTLARAMRLRTSGPDREQCARRSPPDVAIVVRAVDRALRRVPLAHGRCLVRSIVLSRMLEDEQPELRIGVQKSAIGIRAHAWLELNGVAVADHGVGAFTPLSAQCPPRNTRSTGS